MIGADQLVNGIWMGTVLILLGGIPGLYGGIGEGLCRASNQMYLRFGIPLRLHAEFRPPRWFVAAGVAMIAATLLAAIFRL